MSTTIDRLREAIAREKNELRAELTASREREKKLAEVIEDALRLLDTGQYVMTFERYRLCERMRTSLAAHREAGE